MRRKRRRPAAGVSGTIARTHSSGSLSTIVATERPLSRISTLTGAPFGPGNTERSGTIIVVNSLAGLRASALSGVPYSASKFAAAGLVQSINAEENKNGIRATSVFPGDINTPLLDKRPNPPAKELRVNMLQPDDVTDCVMLAVNLPERVVVEELVVRPRG